MQGRRLLRLWLLRPLVNLDVLGDRLDAVDYFRRHLDAAEAQATAAGAVYLRGRPTEATKSNYEVKFRDPTGIVFDLSAEGWKGAVKEVKPAE